MKLYERVPCHVASYAKPSPSPACESVKFVAQAHVLAEKTFTSWDPYTHALSLAHRLQNLGLFDDFNAWLNRHMHFLHEQLDKWSCLTILHAATCTIHNTLKFYHSKEDVRVFLFEFLKFCVAWLRHAGFVCRHRSQSVLLFGSLGF